MDRFFRTEILVGKDKLARLHKSRVCVLGIGAVGGYALEGLARAGVGHFTLVDFDRVSVTNINRQLLATEHTVGQLKVDTARDRVLSINPNATIQTFAEFADKDSIGRILADKPDVVIDAMDSLSLKVQVMASVHRSGIPLVSSMGAATRTDPTKVRIADLFDTRHCPLAARLRKALKEQGIGRGIQCVYSEEIQDAHALSLSPEESKDVPFQRGRARRTLGSLSTITGIFGLTAATAALHILCDGSLKKSA